ncbi:MAG: tetratricopeptide repeat protein, partial [Candidatus Hydrogenedentes bacterium]|nr:tetratricopeptide repeat protein [Candidatus Hydrogenedentota bacterium]
DDLASIYEDNLLWSEAIAVRKDALARLAGNPYAQCRAWRAIGRDYERVPNTAEAIAAYERALGLAAPGNWLFDDVTARLVDVYDRAGDLDGLQRYLEAQIAAAPANVEFADLLGDTLVRRGKLEDAERVFLGAVDRAPDRIAAYERLIALYTRTSAPGKLHGLFEKLIAKFPSEPEYIHRLGESLLAAGDADGAKAAWARVTGPDAKPADYATLASWYEGAEFRDEAIAAYKRAIAGKHDREWVLRLAALEYDAGKTDDAIARWRSALTAESTAADHAEIAAMLATHDRDDDGIALYKKAVELDPAAYEHRAALARLYMAKKAYDDALREFTALEQQPDNEYFKNLGERGAIEVYIATDQLEAKQREWQDAVDKDPEAIAPRLRLARLCQRMGNQQAAIDLYVKCTEIEPDNVEHWRALAAAYTAARQTDKAIEANEKLAAMDAPRMGQYYRELARLYAAANRKDEAIAAAERVAELAPDDADARVALAQTYFTYQRPDDALQQYRNAVRLRPSEPRYHAQYGDALMSTQRWGEAQDTYRRMLDVARSDSERIEAVTRLANVYTQQQRLPELVREFQERTRQTPKSLPAYQELATVYRVSNDYARVVEIYENAAGAVDDKEGALRLLLSAAGDAGKLDKVVSTSEQLIALSGKPTIGEWERLGAAHARMGNIEKARAAWDRIVADHPDDPAAYRMLGRALQNWGQIDDALAACKKAIALDPQDYSFRIQTARQFSMYGYFDEALADLFDMLEASQLEEVPAPTVTTPGQPQMQVMSYVGPGTMWRGRGGYMGPPPGAQPGTLAYHRNEILSALAEAARQVDSADAVIERLVKRTNDLPGNLRVKQDLLDFYVQLGKNNEAAELVKAIVAEQPDNLDLRWQLTYVLRNLQQLDDAAKELQAIVERDPSQEQRVTFDLIGIEQQRGNTAKAIELAEAYRAKHPDDIQATASLAQIVGDLGQTQRAAELFALLIEKDPPSAQGYRMQLARMYQQRGDLAAARTSHEDILFAPRTQQQSPRRGRGRRAFLYVPQPNRANQGRPNMQHALQLQVDYSRQGAFEQLSQMTLDPADLQPVVDRLRAAADAWSTAETLE